MGSDRASLISSTADLQVVISAIVVAVDVCYAGLPDHGWVSVLIGVKACSQCPAMGSPYTLPL